MNWKLKANVFRALSLLPFGSALHYGLQRHVTKELPRKPQALGELLEATRALLAAAREHSGVELGKAHFLEIGAGRDLAVAVALRLLGVGHVTCVDASRLAKPFLISHAARFMATCLKKTAPIIHTWDDLSAFGISYIAPCDLAGAALADASVDCFFSIDTLEHIPVDDLKSILDEARRMLKASGLAIHFVDYSDHYARGDSGLSRFNFLTYSDQEWGPFNTRFHYVNRMRHSEYLTLFESSGLRPVDVKADTEIPQQDIMDRLAPRFRQYSIEDLFTIRARIVGAVKV